MPVRPLLSPDAPTAVMPGIAAETVQIPSVLAPEVLPIASAVAAIETDLSAERWAALDAYLKGDGNTDEDIQKLHFLLMLGMNRVILEIGCGDGDLARRIALENPDAAVLATDLYLWDIPLASGSHYQRVALAWMQRQLAVQQMPPANLLLLRAQVEILRHLPPGWVDTVLMIHPEPRVGRDVLDSLAHPDLYRALKPGNRQVVVLPYSREMGYWVCGGHEFDHSPDWSRGLGFLMESRFAFSRGDRVQWGVDLPHASRYSGNSTQTDVYVAGGLERPEVS